MLIKWFEIHIKEQVTTRQAGINNMVLQNKRGQMLPRHREMGGIPLSPENVDKRSINDLSTL